ncbi:MAG: transglycosylase SLT domain-containing protein [Pseudomonadota bacterium]
MLRLHVSIGLALLVLASCATAPPERQTDACEILLDNRDWYKALRRTAKRWGAPMGLQLAIIKHESSFQQDAKPERQGGFLGIFPGKRPSSAYGYAQALDGTWDRYRSETGNGSADRDDFDDATDFIGWYVNSSGKQAGIGQFAYTDHYLAYHEGAGGYMRGTWRSKGWLIDKAKRVGADADRFERQIRGCKSKLERRWLFW